MSQLVIGVPINGNLFHILYLTQEHIFLYRQYCVDRNNLLNLNKKKTTDPERKILV